MTDWRLESEVWDECWSTIDWLDWVGLNWVGLGTGSSSLEETRKISKETLKYPRVIRHVSIYETCKSLNNPLYYPSTFAGSANHVILP